MFTSKIYECFKQYLDRYLFGFDPDSLNMSILKGNINLRKVNVRPDEVNKILDGLQVPLSLKAERQLSLMSTNLWNNPLELIIDDLYLIMGPNLGFISHDESYIQDDVNSQHDHGNNNQLDDSYDSTNVYNIFDHELQIKKKPKNIDKGTASKSQNDPEEEGDSLKANMRSVIKNLKLTVNRLHIRFEDDYFSSGESKQWEPFSLGIVLDKFEIHTSDTQWNFDSHLKTTFQRVHPPFQHREQERNGNGSIILKEANVNGARLYYKQMSEMFIPTSLWESTRHLENQIFDAIPADQLAMLMKQAFDARQRTLMFHVVSEFNLISNYYNFMPVANVAQTTSFFGKFQQTTNSVTNGSKDVKEEVQVSYVLSHLDINLTPQFINDLSRLMELFQNHSLQNDLKQYRPQRRPMVTPPGIQISEQLKRKKRLLVRDWFFYVIWYIRLKRLLLNYYCSEQLLEKDLSTKDDQQINKDQLLAKLQNHEKLKSEVHLEQQEELFIRGNTIKLQGLTVKVFENTYQKYKTKDQECLPTLEVVMDTLSISTQVDTQLKTRSRKFMIKEIKGFHTLLEKRSLNQKVTMLNRNSTNKKMPSLQQVPTRAGMQQIAAEYTQKRNDLTNINHDYRTQVYSQTNQAPPPSTWHQTNQVHQPVISQAEKEEEQEQSIFTGLRSAFDNILSVFNSPSTFDNNPVLTEKKPFNPFQTTDQPNSSNHHQSLQNFQSFSNQLNQGNPRQQPTNQNFASQIGVYEPSILSNVGGLTSIRYPPQKHTLNQLIGGAAVASNRVGNSRAQGSLSNFQSLNGASSYMQGYQQRTIIDHGRSDINKFTMIEEEYNAAVMTTGFNGETRKVQSYNVKQQIVQDHQRQPRVQRLSDYQTKWRPLVTDHEKHLQFKIAKIQFMNLTGQQQQHSSYEENCAFAFSIIEGRKDESKISQKNRVSIKSEVSIKIGVLDIEYQNSFMSALCEVVIPYKDIHALRYSPLKNLLLGRSINHHLIKRTPSRQIELLTPLYLVKKAFTLKPLQVFSSQTPPKVQIPIRQDMSHIQVVVSNVPVRPGFMRSNNNNFDRGNATGSDGNEEEEENITEEEDKEQESKRLIIQDAVCLRTQQQKVKGNERQPEILIVGKKPAYHQRLNGRDQDQQTSIYSHEDQLLIKRLIDYNKKHQQDDMEITFTIASVDITLLREINVSDISLGNHENGALARLKFEKGYHFDLYKTEHESGFISENLQFQSMNSFEVYLEFLTQMRGSLNSYLSHPVFSQASSKHTQILRDLIRKQLRIISSNDHMRTINLNDAGSQNMEGIKNIFEQSTQNVAQLKLASSNQNNPLQGIGKTPNAGISGNQSSSHYNILFANISSQHEGHDLTNTSNATPKISYQNKGMSLGKPQLSSKNHFQQDVKFFQQPNNSKQGELDIEYYESQQMLQAQYTDEEGETFREAKQVSLTQREEIKEANELLPRILQNEDKIMMIQNEISNGQKYMQSNRFGVGSNTTKVHQSQSSMKFKQPSSYDGTNRVGLKQQQISLSNGGVYQSIPSLQDHVKATYLTGGGPQTLMSRSSNGAPTLEDDEAFGLQERSEPIKAKGLTQKELGITNTFINRKQMIPTVVSTSFLNQQNRVGNQSPTNGATTGALSGNSHILGAGGSGNFFLKRPSPLAAGANAKY